MAGLVKFTGTPSIVCVCVCLAAQRVPATAKDAFRCFNGLDFLPHVSKHVL